jgi:hypothetical protein
MSSLNSNNEKMELFGFCNNPTVCLAKFQKRCMWNVIHNFTVMLYIHMFIKRFISFANVMLLINFSVTFHIYFANVEQTFYVERGTQTL